MEKLLLVVITAGFTVAANADFEMTTKIVDRSGYEGLSNEFCSEVSMQQSKKKLTYTS